MNKEKVFIEGYEVGFLVDTTGDREKKIQVASGEIVSIDERFIYKSIEREKVAIPQFVADWIEVCKEHLTSSLYLAMTPSFLKSNNQGIELTLWIKKNEETFARAWLDGYEIEKQKRYVVTLKNRQPLVKSQSGSILYFSQDITDENYKVTKKELEEANFGWVFDCPGIEIEEVE